MKITGSTALMPIIGHPVSGVFSPPAFNAEFRDRGLDIAMVPMDIAPRGLDAFWTVFRASSNLNGCSVTYPHKQAAYAAMDDWTPRARRLGAVNTIRKQGGRLVGYATDGLAMCFAIKNTGFDVADRSARVLGAGGGAGVAIVDELCASGLKRLVLSEQDAGRRDAVFRLVTTHWPDVDVSDSDGPCDILVNATTLGKNPSDDEVFSEKAISTAAIVADVVTCSTKTQLVTLSEALGVRTVTGDDMGGMQIHSQLSFLGY